MKCYDCALSGRSDTTAIGVCTRCGLVICRDHGRVTRTVIHQSRGTGASTTGRPARRAVCQTCYGAEYPG
ncbi:DUF2180 family protein [Streptomyces sp. NPDC003077]|uniref:DUF2180 family protein n=1 Tax=Streptomyces sp. NPDC003077 TaxID=3154443 RepID=UPI0033ACD696